MPHRLLTLILKELRAILRHKQSRLFIFMPVLLQTAVFPFAATLELNNARLGVFSEDSGPYSLEIIQRLNLAKNFSEVVWLRDEPALRQALDTRKILVLARFPADFSRRVSSGESAPLQLILDGRRSNAAQIAVNYIQDILEQYQRELAPAGSFAAVNASLEFRNWYNPNLDYKWFILPSLIAFITTLGVLIFTALSVAREREQGTLEQLLVSPLTTWQIFVGKAIPALVIACLQGTVVLLAGIFAYRIPFSGSILLFYTTMLLYGLSLIGVGLMISALSSTQQQAFIGVFLFMMPCILLSGFIAPVENMPEWLQNVSMINPVRHFMEITKQIYLKDAALAVLWKSLGPLIAITGVTSTAAYALFRRKVA